MNKQSEYYAISHFYGAIGNKGGDRESIRPRLRLLWIIKKGLCANTLTSENYCDQTSVHLSSWCFDTHEGIFLLDLQKSNLNICSIVEEEWFNINDEDINICK